VLLALRLARFLLQSLHRGCPGDKVVCQGLRIALVVLVTVLAGDTLVILALFG
jgi:hypothetical protein